MDTKQNAKIINPDEYRLTNILQLPALFKQTLFLALVVLVAVLIVSGFYLRFGPNIVQRLDNNVGENLMKFAEALEQNKNTEDAKRIYEIATRSRFTGEFNRTHVFYRLGYLYWEDRDYVKAAEYLKEAVQSKEFPQISAFEFLVDSLLQIQKPEEALPFAQQWTEKTRNREELANAQYYLGKVYGAMNRMAEAEETWSKGHKVLPGSKSSSELAFLYKKQGDCKKAVYYAEAVLKAGLLPSREPAIKTIIEQCKKTQEGKTINP